MLDIGLRKLPRALAGGLLRRRWIPSLFVALAMILAMIPSALAVNSTGAFELDGNATTNHSGTGPPDDWDRVCHQVLGTDCSTSDNTNGATAVAFGSQTVATGTAFTGGGSKDPIDISSWAWTKGIGGLPGKDALLNGFAARYSLPANASTCPSSTATCSVMFFGMDRFDNSGDAQNGFWFFQNAISLTGTGTSGSGSPFVGVHKNGDLLLVSDFSIGGTTSIISAYEWNSACTAAGKPMPSCADSNLQLLQTSSAANCATSAANAPFCGIVNPANGTAAPWSYTDKSGNTSFKQGDFYEGGINLSAFPGLATECFASMIAESRSSTSTSATLKSFVLMGFAPCGSTTKTTPQDSLGNGIANGSVSIGTGSVQPMVKDQAVVTVTGAGSFGGTVTFHLCGPADLVSQSTCLTGGTLVGAATAISPPSPVTVTSNLATVTQVGSYCWRADYSGDSSVGVPPSSDGSSTECFTVTPVTPTLATAAGAGPVILGNPVTDTATLSGTANEPGSPVINPTTAGSPAKGSITFTLYGPNSCTTVAAGTGTNPQTASVSGDGTYGPVSFTPNAVGTYHWVASYSGDSPNTLGTSHNTGCTDTAEDVTVQQIATTTVTTPSVGSGGTAVFGSSVTDHAVVTAVTTGAGTPTGTITFFVCTPSQTSGGACPSPNGTQVGSPVAASAVSGSNPPASQADSSGVTVNQTGTWCFRAVYAPNISAYTGSSDASSGECFTVTDTSSETSAQTWLPNDTGTVSSAHGAPLNGTQSFTLYSDATCGNSGGSVIRTAETFPVSGVASQTKTTSNTTVSVTLTQAVSWLESFTSTDPNVASSSHCETTSLTISN